MTHKLRTGWLFLAIVKFLFALWLKRRPNVLNNLLRIAFGPADRKGGAQC